MKAAVTSGVMRLGVLSVAAAFLITLIILSSSLTEAQAPACYGTYEAPCAPHPDLFSCGVQTCDVFSPVTQKAKAQRTVGYRLLIMPGCTAGTIYQDMAALETEMQTKVGFSLVRNDAAYDFTVRQNCGSEQIRICGAVNIFCLGRGFPYVADVEISDILSTYQPITRLSILCHEICGHVAQSANEQYCLGTETMGICRGLALFSPAPGWRDFMSTGELSRHGFEAIEIDRWARTMYALTQECVSPAASVTPVWDQCLGRWLMPDGTSFEPSTGRWWDQRGVARFGACNQDHLRLDLLDMHWWRIPLENLGFDYDLGLFVVVPEC